MQEEQSRERLRGIVRTLCEAAERNGLPDETADEFAYHMTDWLDELDGLNRVFADPGSMTDEERDDAVMQFVIHAPAHLAAASRMYMGFPVRDVWEIGAVDSSPGEALMTDHPVLREAAFDRGAIKKYYLWQPTIVLACSVVGIPLIPFVLVITVLVMDRYLDRLSCTLTNRTLEIRKGLLNRVESTVPLEKITDLQMFQGPVMRVFGLHGFKLETAGQSAGPGASLVNMIGIRDTPGFRRAVLAQRDALADGGRRAAPEPAAAPDTDVLREIRDVLVRIERRLGEGGAP